MNFQLPILNAGRGEMDPERIKRLAEMVGARWPN
jgi:hypothetical protein